MSARARSFALLLASLLVASLLVACGPSAPAVYAEDVVLPAPGGAARAGIPPDELLGLASLEGETAAPADPAGGAEVEDDDEAEETDPDALPPRLVTGPGFAYELPGDWDDLDPATLGSALLVAAQRAAAPADGFMTNASVAVEAFDGDRASYGAVNVEELEKICLVESVRPSRVGAHASLDVEASWANDGGVPYRTLQRYVSHGGVGLVITCAAAQSAFERERPTCEAIVESLRIE